MAQVEDEKLIWSKGVHHMSPAQLLCHVNVWLEPTRVELTHSTVVSDFRLMWKSHPRKRHLVCSYFLYSLARTVLSETRLGILLLLLGPFDQPEVTSWVYAISMQVMWWRRRC